MIAELGCLALILALLAALLLVTVPLFGIIKGNHRLQQLSSYYLFCQSGFVFLAYLCLTACFVLDDFTVRYVLANSSLSLPLFYKLCAVWGGHEGSMLLWVAILSLWMLLVGFFSQGLDSLMRTRVLVILGFLSAGFILFLLTTSNPFARQFQELHTVGRDLNPLLQDPGFLFHPPMLYMGYVGFAVAFAFAMAALWAGRVEPSWTKWVRPWTLAAWCCLTAGITLGSWWAYRELGWGGWWFWDPVENASFMPWLIGTALIHSLMVTEQRQQFKAWTLLLAITGFSLSLIGTFLVRSGVLTSVHAFAVDPLRGLYILGFLSLIIGGSLLLFGFRAHRLTTNQGPQVISKESALLFNNVFLVVLMLTVLMGTVYPLLVDGLGLGKLSVGAPYFNAVFVPLVLPMLFLMGLGLHLKWQKDSLKACIRKLPWLCLASMLIPVFLLAITGQGWQWHAFLGLALALWVIFSTLSALIQRWQRQGLAGIGQAYWGMVLAHLGVAVTVIGIAISSTYGRQEDLPMAPGQQISLQAYHIAFIQQAALQGPNYTGMRAEFAIKKGKQVHTIYPEKRRYTVGQMVMTESAIDVSPFRDIYIALGEPQNADSWSVRIYYKPLVRWIWFGGFMILGGGLLALTDRRYYRKRAAAGELCQE